MERANVQGATLEYEILGSGEPVLLIHGALVAELRVLGESTIPWFVDSDELLGDWLPNNERSTIPGVGHFLQMEDPRPIAESLAPFFARHSMR